MTWFDDEGAPIDQEPPATEQEVDRPPDDDPAEAEAIDPMAQAHIDGLAAALDGPTVPAAALVDLIERQNATDEAVKALTGNVDRLIDLVQAALGPRSEIPAQIPAAPFAPEAAGLEPEPEPPAAEPEIPGGIDLAYFNGSLPEVDGPGDREPSNRSTYRGEL